MSTLRAGIEALVRQAQMMSLEDLTKRRDELRLVTYGRVIDASNPDHFERMLVEDALKRINALPADAPPPTEPPAPGSDR